MTSATDTTTTPPALGRTAPIVKVNGQDIDLGNVLSVRVEQGLCVPTRVTLRFRDIGHAVAKSSTYTLGTEVVVKVDDATIATTWVTAVHASRNFEDFAEFVVTADDYSYKLSRGILPTAYLAKTYSETIRAILGDAQLTPNVSASAFPSGPADYQMQATTGVAYINQLCRRYGAYWFVDPSDGKTLYVKAPAESVGSATKNVNDDMFDFSLRASGLRPTAVQISTWNPETKAAVTSTVSSPASRGTVPTFVSSYVGNVSDLGTAQSSFGGYNPKDASDAQKIAGGLLDDGADGSVIARGTCFADANIKPGAKLTLDNKSDMFAGDYFVSEAEHVYSAKGFFTKFVAGPHRTTHLVETLGRPDSEAGLYNNLLVVAQVTDNNDPNKKFGRVKVQFVALPGSPTPVSAWARVTTIGAGASRGFMWLPEVGDEVIVGFELGDVRRPVVLGSVWNGSDMPLSTTLVDGSVKSRQLVSVAGHVIDFGEDTTDTANHLKFVVKDGPTLRLGKDETTLDTNSKPLTLTIGSTKITVDKDGNTTIDSAGTLSLKAKQDITIEGQNVNIKGKQNAVLEGTSQATVKGAQAEVNGSAKTAIKGGMVQVN
ncbi:MAG TPA: phage baseplate assembly protein V [Jatrophihabitans sp.]|jgi:hypothetical protein